MRAEAEELDRRIAEALRQDMARTWRIAQLLGMARDVPRVRRRLTLMEERGEVRRNARYTYPQDIMWELVE